eukprot:g8300.t1
MHPCQEVHEIALHIDAFRNIDLFHQGLYYLVLRVDRARLVHNFTRGGAPSYVAGAAERLLLREGQEEDEEAEHQHNPQQSGPSVSSTNYNAPFLHDLAPPQALDRENYRSKVFVVRYCEEEVELNEVCVFRMLRPENVFQDEVGDHDALKLDRREGGAVDAAEDLLRQDDTGASCTFVHADLYFAELSSNASERLAGSSSSGRASSRGAFDRDELLRDHRFRKVSTTRVNLRTPHLYSPGSRTSGNHKPSKTSDFLPLLFDDSHFCTVSLCVHASGPVDVLFPKVDEQLLKSGAIENLQGRVRSNYAQLCESFAYFFGADSVEDFLSMGSFYDALFLQRSHYMNCAESRLGELLCLCADATRLWHGFLAWLPERHREVVTCCKIWYEERAKRRARTEGVCEVFRREQQQHQGVTADQIAKAHEDAAARVRQRRRQWCESGGLSTALEVSPGSNSTCSHRGTAPRNGQLADGDEMRSAGRRPLQGGRTSVNIAPEEPSVTSPGLSRGSSAQSPGLLDASSQVPRRFSVTRERDDPLSSAAEEDGLKSRGSAASSRKNATTAESASTTASPSKVGDKRSAVDKSLARNDEHARPVVFFEEYISEGELHAVLQEQYDRIAKLQTESVGPGGEEAAAGDSIILAPAASEGGDVVGGPDESVFSSSMGPENRFSATSNAERPELNATSGMDICDQTDSSSTTATLHNHKQAAFSGEGASNSTASALAAPATGVTEQSMLSARLLSPGASHLAPVKKSGRVRTLSTDDIYLDDYPTESTAAATSDAAGPKSELAIWSATSYTATSSSSGEEGAKGGEVEAVGGEVVRSLAPSTSGAGIAGGAAVLESLAETPTVDEEAKSVFLNSPLFTEQASFLIAQASHERKQDKDVSSEGIYNKLLPGPPPPPTATTGATSKQIPLVELLRRQLTPRQLQACFLQTIKAKDLIPCAPKVPRLALHLVVLVHGFQGNRFDMRLVKNLLAVSFPELVLLSSSTNEDNMEDSIESMGQRLAQEITDFIKDTVEVGTSGNVGKNASHLLGKISFVAHSLGGLIVRSCVEKLQPELQKLLFTYVSLSTPHLGYAQSLKTSKWVQTGIWLLRKMRRDCKCLQELCMEDQDSTSQAAAAGGGEEVLASTTRTSSSSGAAPRQCLLYRLGGFQGFKNVLLASSYQDTYAPYASARVQVGTCAGSSAVEKKAEQEEDVASEIAKRLLASIDHEAGARLYRMDVSFSFPERSLDTIVGRAAHIQFLESHHIIRTLVHGYPFLFR